MRAAAGNLRSARRDPPALAGLAAICFPARTQAQYQGQRGRDEELLLGRYLGIVVVSWPCGLIARRSRAVQCSGQQTCSGRSAGFTYR